MVYHTHECLYKKYIVWMNKYWPILMSVKTMTFNLTSMFCSNDGSRLNVIMTTLKSIKCVKWWMIHFKIRGPLQAGLCSCGSNHFFCGYKVYVKHMNTMFWRYLYPCIIILQATPAFRQWKIWHWKIFLTRNSGYFSCWIFTKQYVITSFGYFNTNMCVPFWRVCTNRKNDLCF